MAASPEATSATATDAAAIAADSSAASGRERWLFALYAGHLLTLFGIALSNIFLGLAILAAPFLAVRAGARLRRGRPLLIALAAYAALLLVAIACSRDRAISLGSLRELFSLAALPLALIAVRDERRLRLLVDTLIVIAAVLAVLGLSQLALGYGSIDRRIRGPFSHVMTYSGVLLLIDLMLIARMILGPEARRGASAEGGGGETGRRGWQRWQRWRRLLDRRWFAWTCLVLINIALLNTLTRSAWLGLIAGLLGLVWVRRRDWLLALPAAAILFVVLAPVPVLARMISTANLSDESTYDRLCMLDAGLKMVSERPLTGLGPELAERRYPIYRDPSGNRLNAPHLHNSYLQLAAERGVPALLSYLALVAIALGASWRAYRAELVAGDGRSDLYLGAITAFAAFSLAGMFENNWGDTEVQRMAVFLLALPFCLRRAGEAAPERAA